LGGKQHLMIFVSEKIRCCMGAGLRAFFGEEEACF
jgi:hypothetical protein